MLAPLVRLFFVLLLLTSPAWAEDIRLSGDVTYRERIALPPDAELWITLVSLPDGATVVSAAAEVSRPAQVPLSFVLDVRSHVVAAGGDFGLVAEIRSEGRTLFRNTEPVPVDVQAPAPVLIVVAMPPQPTPEPVPLPVPLPEPVPDDEEIMPPIEEVTLLLDTVWMVTSIGGDPVLPDTEPTLSIAADRRVGGSGGCNNYFTEAEFDEAALAFGPIASTRMACAGDVMAQENRLFNALSATAGYALSGDALQLVDAAGVTLVGLVRAP